MKKGLFVTFEGGEGSGKSTAIRAATAFFKKRKCSVVFLREPGGTLISEKIREIILDRKHNRMAVETELLLYLAARAQIIREKILPALKQGKVVICDRFHDSTVAYQGYAGGLSLKVIQQFAVFVKGGVEPDLTLLLDVNVKTGLKRAGRTDRMEQKSLQFHERVRRGFLTLAKNDPRRIKLIQDQPSIEKKMEKVREVLEASLKRKHA